MRSFGAVGVRGVVVSDWANMLAKLDAYLPFDDTAGDTSVRVLGNDAANGDATASNIASIASVRTTGPVSGVPAIAYPGDSGAFIDLTANHAGLFRNVGVSVMGCWINRANTNAFWLMFASRGDNGNSARHILDFLAGGNVRHGSRSQDSDGFAGLSMAGVPVGAWSHIHSETDHANDRMRTWIDGVLIRDATQGDGLTASNLTGSATQDNDSVSVRLEGAPAGSLVAMPYWGTTAWTDADRAAFTAGPPEEIEWEPRYMAVTTTVARRTPAIAQASAGRRGLPVFVSTDDILTSPASLIAEGSTSGGSGAYWPALWPAGRYLGADALDNWYLFASPDHAVSNGGIWLATAPSWRGPWTWTNSGNHVFRYGTSGSGPIDWGAAGGGNQTETPTLIWDNNAGKLNMLFHNRGVVVNGVTAQVTGLAISSDAACSRFAPHDNGAGVPWVIGPPSTAILQGEPHFGYPRLAHDGALLTAVHRYDGSQLALGVSHSLDNGKTWTRNYRYQSGSTTAQNSAGNLTQVTAPCFARIGGQLWGFLTGNLGGETSPYIGAARYADDGSYSRRLHEPIPIVMPSAEGRELTTPDVVVDGDEIVITYVERRGPNTSDEQHLRMAYVRANDWMERMAA